MSAFKVYDDIDYYFITSTIINWYPVFAECSYFDLIIESLKYCRKEKYLRIHAYVVMLNHIHLVVSVKREASKELSNVMRDFSSIPQEA